MRFHIWFDSGPKLVRVNKDRFREIPGKTLNIVIANFWLRVGWGKTPDS